MESITIVAPSSDEDREHFAVRAHGVNSRIVFVLDGAPATLTCVKNNLSASRDITLFDAFKLIRQVAS